MSTLRVFFFIIVYIGIMNNVSAGPLIIDDRSSGNKLASINSEWEFIADTVMGGISQGSLTIKQYKDRDCLCLRGDVSTDNNGGFVQMALPVSSVINAESDYAGIELDIAGNDEAYNVHFRTSNLSRPWQSYRASFIATTNWQTIRLPFSELNAYQTELPFQLNKLARIGLVAIGRDFEAKLCLAGLRFYREE